MSIPDQIAALQDALLTEIQGFIVERKVTESTFGRLAVNDGKFVARLRARENMTTGLIERAHGFIRAERTKVAA